ncbi:MFS transporter [Bacillus sp. AFS055030]|uniref:MFS transporter n=1 Tax=Bacillus sp. AFS055030 TaxID=2033507 RepID=UPI000BFBF5AA|nr:MFS transporter [Bacillus sp. AFS055030]PGL73247.1 MFS transporter [Bacillus sp. AFS055030]
MTSQRWMSLQFFGFFFTFGIFVPYWSAWLTTSKGFTADEAGLIIALGLITRSITTFFIFPFISRYLNLARLNQVVSLISVMLLIILIPFNSLIAVAFITVLLSLVYPMPLAMYEAMASILIRECKIEYGKSRSYGSIGYIISLSLTGILISLKSENVVIYFLMIGCVLLTFITSIRAPIPLRTKITSKKVPLFKLFKSKAFLIVLTICITLQAAHAAYYSYAVLFLKNIGVKTSFTGFILIIAVLSEIAFFYVSDFLFKRRSVPALLMFSVSASILRWVLISSFNSISVFVLSQLLHSITFGLTQYAFVKYLDENIENKYFPFAHGIYAALGLSLGSGILTLVSGYLYSISPSFTFLGMALVCVPCLGLCYFLKLTLGDQNNLTGEISENVTSKRKSI